jgi:hypothetical protein
VAGWADVDGANGPWAKPGSNLKATMAVENVACCAESQLARLENHRNVQVLQEAWHHRAPWPALGLQFIEHQSLPQGDSMVTVKSPATGPTSAYGKS